MGDKGEQLRRIEEKLFSDKVKNDVEEESGKWVGSSDQNKLADFEIAMSIKSAFKLYEKSKKFYEKAYFKF